MTKTMPITTAASSRATSTQKVAVVNGSTDMLQLLEAVLDAGHYDVVFVESGEHAYSHIKRVQPDLVILCIGFEEPYGCQVLSMLKLDAETRPIPVMIYTSGLEDEEPDGMPDTPDSEMLAAAKAAMSMN